MILACAAVGRAECDRRRVDESDESQNCRALSPIVTCHCKRGLVVSNEDAFDEIKKFTSLLLLPPTSLFILLLFELASLLSTWFSFLFTSFWLSWLFFRLVASLRRLLLWTIFLAASLWSSATNFLFSSPSAAAASSIIFSWILLFASSVSLRWRPSLIFLARCFTCDITSYERQAQNYLETKIKPNLFPKVCQAPVSVGHLKRFNVASFWQFVSQMDETRFEPFWVSLSWITAFSHRCWTQQQRWWSQFSSWHKNQWPSESGLRFVESGWNWCCSTALVLPPASYLSAAVVCCLVMWTIHPQDFFDISF